MVDAVESELEQAGVEEKPEVVVADAGYWHQEQMENIVGRGIQVLIPVFADTKFDRRLHRFLRRGRAACRNGG